MKKHLVFLVAVLLIFTVFAGCGGSPTAAEEPSQAPKATPAPTTSEPVTSEKPQSVKLPITEEKTTITDWKTIQTLSAVFMDWNNCTGYQEIEKLTNIHVDFTIPAYGNEVENFNLLMASNDYPDIIEFFTAYYTRGIDDAIAQDIVIRLNEVVDQYMPNYKALIQDPERALKTVSDSGNIGALYCIYDEPQNLKCYHKSRDGKLTNSMI
jgi:putative aldouronate transport system substrate-binding protein